MVAWTSISAADSAVLKVWRNIQNLACAKRACRNRLTRRRRGLLLRRSKLDHVRLSIVLDQGSGPLFR
jgi:hypothetical protein